MSDLWPMLGRNVTGRPVDLSDAVLDIRAALEDRGGPGKPLLGAEAEVVAEAITVTVTGPLHTRTLRLSAAVVRRAQAEGVGPLRLVAAALAARSDLDDGWWPCAESVDDSAGAIRELLARHEHTSADEQIIQSLTQLHDVVLVGRHGTGKSATVAARADAFRTSGGGLIWLDLADTGAGPHTVYEGFLRAERHGQYLVVVDATQANIPVLQDVFAAAAELRDPYGISLAILATGLSALVHRMPDLFRNFRHVIAKPGEILDAMLGGTPLDREQRESVRALAKNDLVIARLAITFQERYGQVPTRRDLEEMHAARVTGEDQRRALYWFACLGYFQIDVSIQAATAKVGADMLSWLLGESLVVKSNGHCSAGPRSRAELALRYALREWDAEKQWKHPAELAWQHLRVAGEPAIRAVLDRLDRIGAGADQTGSPDNPTRYLLPAWDNVRSLERYLAKLCQADPTWLDNAGAAVFAGLAMARMRNAGAWSAVARFIRTRWTYETAHALPAPAGAPTADQQDFPKIFKAMQAEDRQTGLPRAAGWESAEQIDLDTFHRAWMLGLLLCFEGSALFEDGDRIRRLQAIAAAVQHPDGFFYPRRVPWVTARVVLGLCATGLSYDTSDVVRQACDWLLSPVEAGGAFDSSWWRSGTGSWNRQEATTAMCLAALLHADAPPTPRQELATAWLWTDQALDQCGQPGREIDLAFVVEATSLDGERWRDAYPLVRKLLPWAVEAHRSPPPMADVNEGDLRLPFVTYELMTFVWRLVNREFSVMLTEMLELPPEPAGFVLDQAAWAEAVQRLIDRIDADLMERDRHLNASSRRDVAVHEHVEELKKARARSVRLKERLATESGPDLLDEIDKLGEKYCGAAWVPVPRKER